MASSQATEETPASGADAYTAVRKTAARNQLEDDVERFLAEGGNIEQVPRDFRADPPKKPESNYGRGSI